MSTCYIRSKTAGPLLTNFCLQLGKMSARTALVLWTTST